MRGVVVTGGGNSATTDRKGKFRLQGLAEDSTVTVQFARRGYAFSRNGSSIVMNGNRSLKITARKVATGRKR